MSFEETSLRSTKDPSLGYVLQPGLLHPLEPREVRLQRGERSRSKERLRTRLRLEDDDSIANDRIEERNGRTRNFHDVYVQRRRGRHDAGELERVDVPQNGEVEI